MLLKIPIKIQGEIFPKEVILNNYNMMTEAMWCWIKKIK